MNSLFDLFRRQKKYNEEIRQGQPDNLSQWTQTYLLGIVSEIDEVLREIDWKKHRKGNGVLPSRINVAYELADITKYVISLWELWGFDSYEMLSYCHLKSEILEQKKRQEYAKISEGLIVVITDLDGTLADWRRSFGAFLADKGYQFDDSSSTLTMDVDMNLGYTEYNALKEEFESSGGYCTLEPYTDGIAFVNVMSSLHQAYVIAITARPVHRHKRIWNDTWIWMSTNRMSADQLIMGSESRVVLATSLMKTNKVILLEDNPELMLRAASSGVTVISRRHGYNKDITHPNIHLVNDFSEIDVDELLKGLIICP